MYIYAENYLSFNLLRLVNLLHFLVDPFEIYHFNMTI